MKNNPRFSNGILLNLYKHIDAAKLIINDIKDDYVILKTTVSFGNFDRLRFYPIVDFADFRKQSCTGHLWTGGRRDIMLFSLSEDENKHSFRFICEEDDLKDAIEKNDKSCKDIFPWKIEMLEQNRTVAKRRFLCVSMLYLSGMAKNLGLPYQGLIDKCRETISKIVDRVNKKKQAPDKPIIYEVFGSLNSAELAIIWGAEQYVEVQYIVDQLRFLQLKLPQDSEKYRVIFSSYTIVAFNGSSPDLTDVRGGSMIQFTTSTKEFAFGSNFDDAMRFIKGETPNSVNGEAAGDIYSCAGEYDFIYNGKASELIRLERKNASGSEPPNYGKYDDCEPDFQKHFSATTTRLYYSESDICEVASIINEDREDLLTIELQPSDLDPSLPNQKDEWKKETPQVFKGRSKDKYRDQYQKYTEKLKKLFSGQNAPYRGLAGQNILYNLDLLFCDYVQCVSTMPHNQWARDFEYQFSSALSVLTQTLPSFEELNHSKVDPRQPFELDIYIEKSREIIALLQHGIHHMADAGKLFFEEPSSHSESTGQYDLIIHTYYGIIKSVLREIAKNSGKLKEQPSLLVPILHFSGQPIIKSKLYEDEIELSQKLVEICIPYDACGEIGLYAPLLIHELYHYVPPIDRVARNNILGIILLIELTVDMLQRIIKDMASDEVIRSVCGVFRTKLSARLDRTAFSAAMQNLSVNSNNWHSFFEALLSWIKGFHNDGTEDSSFQLFFKPLLEATYEGLREVYEKESDESETKKLITRLSTVIAPPVIPDEEDKNCGECLLYRLKRCDNNVFDEICQALREMLPDYAMVHFSGLSNLSDYLLLFAIAIDKQYSIVGNTNKQSFLVLRIGFITDLILYRFKGSMNTLEAELQKTENEFIMKYNAYRRLGICDDAPEQNETYITEAQIWFGFFRNLLQIYRDTCDCYRNLLKSLANEQFSPGMRLEKEKVWATLMAPFSALTKSKTQHFQAELDIIRAFQPQWFLEKLQERNPNAPSASEDSSLSAARTTPSASDLVFFVDHYLEAARAIDSAAGQLQEYHRQVFGKQSRPRLWFRGCKSCTYPVLPSIMTLFLERDLTCPSGKNYIGTLVEYQRALLEEFKSRADGASEFINASSYTTADYIALMQHYSQKTCYLDWSDDAYSSLYFALEEEIREAEKIIKNKPENGNGISNGNESAMGSNQMTDNKQPKQENLEPVLYIFDPKLYNLARLRLLNKYSKEIRKQFCFEPKHPIDGLFKLFDMFSSMTNKQYLCTTAKKDHQEPLIDPDTKAIYEVVAKDLFDAERVEKDIKSKRLSDVIVPNISMRYAAERYGIHSFNLIHNDGLKDAALRCDAINNREDLKSATFATKNHESDALPCFVGDLWNLPLAIYTSRLNPRIRTQSGNFLAYSVFSRPICCKDEQKNERSLIEETSDKARKTEYFKYLSLKDIQNFYLDEFKNDEQPGLPFLIEVIIPKGEKIRLAEYLYHVGFNKYRIYPELDNLSLS